MKTNFFLSLTIILLISFNNQIVAQEKTNAKEVKEEPIYAFTNQSAEYPGGVKALRTLIAENIVYPQKCKENEEQSIVYVRFVIKKDGSIDQITLHRKSKYPAINKEALRLMSLLEKWIPAEQNGEVVHSWRTISFNFKSDKLGLGTYM